MTRMICLGLGSKIAPQQSWIADPGPNQKDSDDSETVAVCPSHFVFRACCSLSSCVFVLIDIVLFIAET